ncbi:molybdenum ABC transporter ATP-binding protein [Vibrio maritimus]|uniref:molybdenum ABC transporter ATP-binding protein n=1 Tax=Vibrio maritimus TaxID=990268 RepID=UPI0037353032
MGAMLAQFNVTYSDFQLAVDLSLPATGVTVLFGRSGSGKTTCLRAIAGLDKQVQGYFSLQGDVWQDSREGCFTPTYQRELGYVFQQAGLFPHLSVDENLEFGRKRIGVEARKVDKQTICDLLGISDLLRRRTHNLSGGECQRVAIARALLTSPKLLLMDEPLSALDNGLKAEILPYLEKLHRELSIPIIYVTHSVAEVARLADYLVLFEKGQVVSSGPAVQIMADPQFEFLFGDDMGCVLDAQVTHHYQDQITALSVGDEVPLFIPQHVGVIGETHRCRVLASDVSISLVAPERTSILNILPASIVECTPAKRLGEQMVVLELANKSRLLALITQRSALQLQLEKGQVVWAQIKSVAIC